MEKIIKVAPCEALLSLDAIYGLAALLRQMGRSRRQVLNWLADVIFGWIEAGGIIVDGDGYEIEITPDIIDDAHGDDASVKWPSEVLRRAANAPRRRSRSSLLLRLQLYDAAARITSGRSIVDLGKKEGANT